jgi:putative addiction module killer protein
MGYSMSHVEETLEFRRWLDALKDVRGRARVMVRIDRLIHGNPGDHRNLRLGVSELRIDVGPGYRVYYTVRRIDHLVLLAGGDKSSQSHDVMLAIRLATDLEG